MSLFEGVIKKSGSDINRPFRKRFCSICWEKNETPKKISLQKTASLPLHYSQSQNSCKQLVFIYCKHKEKKAGVYKGKFVLDNSDFREVPEGINDYQNVICIKLSQLHNGKNGGRELYLSLKTEEEKKCLLKVLRDHIKISPSHNEYIEDTLKPPTKFIPFDDNNPLLKELEIIQKTIRNQNEDEAFNTNDLTRDFRLSSQENTYNLKYNTNSRQSFDSGFGSIISPTSSISRNSYSSSIFDIDNIYLSEQDEADNLIIETKL
ncbi:uncharacterized protein LOC100212773 [Hydra vulgaris]|uniref:uncharacterized protein LOC100212773 n=1 Tax=Hydra vulgaris TaxID=6087 RepID=UPI000640D944|nr:uncharacterized protein LOC100212773 [Hydra vulgaris]